MNIRIKTLSGFLWSFIDSFVNLGIQFIVGIILARILSPKEFGLIGSTTIFILIFQVFVDGGLSSALIRKQKCTNEDYCTVFYFNLTISFFCFGLLFFVAPLIGQIFAQLQLVDLVRVLALVLIINALGIVQRTMLNKNLDFKTQALISLVSSLGSGILAITMALLGYGIWSLVILTLARASLSSVFLWIYVKWVPAFIFNWVSFKQLFGFGSKLLISGLIDTIFNNSYLLIIAKYFSVTQLAYYTRADQFKSLPSQQLTGIINRVSYPTLAELQDDPISLKNAYVKLIKSSAFLSFLSMLTLAAIAESLIITLIGKKWSPAIEYLQIICFVGMLHPLHVLNLNMLQLKGRSDLFLKLEIIKKILVIPIIVLGIYCGIKWMIVGMILHSLVGFYLNSFWSGTLLNYSLKDQITDILPSIGFAVLVALPVFLIGYFMSGASFLELIIQLITALILVTALGEYKINRDYTYIRNLIIDTYTQFKPS